MIRACSWAAVIPAAGESRRMGRLKPLLAFGPSTVIERVIAVAREASLSPIAVVLGHRAEEIATVISGDCLRVDNPSYRDGGMLSSVQRGIEALGACDGIVLLLADQPAIEASTIRALGAAWDAEGRPRDRVYIPTFEGRPGHPIAIASGLFEPILAWRGEEGLRGFLGGDAARIRDVPVSDPGILLDIDTEEDYERAIALRVRPGGARPH